MKIRREQVGTVPTFFLFARTKSPIPNFKKFLPLHIPEQSRPEDARITNYILKNFHLIERPKERT